jgi:hypothetical protein
MRDAERREPSDANRVVRELSDASDRRILTVAVGAAQKGDTVFPVKCRLVAVDVVRLTGFTKDGELEVPPLWWLRLARFDQDRSHHVRVLE